MKISVLFIACLSLLTFSACASAPKEPTAEDRVNFAVTMVLLQMSEAEWNAFDERVRKFDGEGGLRLKPGHSARPKYPSYVTGPEIQIDVEAWRVAPVAEREAVLKKVRAAWAEHFPEDSPVAAELRKLKIAIKDGDLMVADSLGNDQWYLWGQRMGEHWEKGLAKRRAEKKAEAEQQALDKYVEQRKALSSPK